MSAASQPPVKSAPAGEETRQLPAFGSGLEFRPQGKLGANKSPAAKTEAAARANGGSVGIMLENEEDAVEDIDNMQDDELVSCFPSCFSCAPSDTHAHSSSQSWWCTEVQHVVSVVQSARRHG